MMSSSQTKFHLFLLLIFTLTLATTQSSSNVFSKLKQGNLISLDKPKPMEIYSNNIVYILELDWKQSFDYFKDPKTLGNEYYIFNLKKSPASLEPFQPNLTYNYSTYGNSWKQNLLGHQSEIALPNLTSQITNCTSTNFQDFHDQVLHVTRKHFVCSKLLPSLITIQDILTDSNSKEIDNSKVIRLLRNLNIRLKEKSPVVFLRIPDDVTINPKAINNLKTMKIRDFTVYMTTEKEGNNTKFTWIFYETLEISAKTISEVVKQIFPDYFHGFIVDTSEHSEHEDETGFKHDMEDFYMLYSKSVNQIRSKLKHLFDSDAELHNKLMYTFEAEELSHLIKKLEELHDEMYFGTYEVLNYGLKKETKERMKNITDGIMAIVGHQMLDEIAIEIKKNKGFFSRYKLSILAGIAFCAYLGILIYNKMKEKVKKIV